MEKSSTSLIIMEMQIKTTMRYHLSSIRMATIKKQKSGVGRMWRNWTTCALLVETQRSAASMDSSEDVVQKIKTRTTAHNPAIPLLNIYLKGLNQDFEEFLRLLRSLQHYSQ